MAITFSGLATGLDTDSIVKELMALERAPLDRIEAKKTSETDRLQAYKQFNDRLVTLKNAVDEMALTSQVKSTSVSLSSEDAFTATSKSSALGSYAISVAQLAQVQKNVSVSSYASTSEAVFGTGTLTINGKVITVDSSNNNLADLAADINDVADETGVSVTIINDGSTGSPYHMIFTGKDANTSFTIASDLVDSESAPIAFDTTEAQAAQQAVLFVDGIKVVSNTNTVSSAISGLTLNLNEESAQSYAGTPEVGVDPWDWADPPVYKNTMVTIQADTDSLKEKVTNFVSAYNSAMEWILSGYDEFGSSTETTSSSSEDDSTEELLGSTLRGDSTINKVKRSLQSVLTDVIKTSGGFSILSEIGISTQLDGTLKQDNTTLDSALEDNFDDVVLLLSGDNDTPGVMKNFKSLLLDLTSTAGGMYVTQKAAYDIKSDRFENQIDQMELRMQKREAALRAQFSAMEQLVSSLNAQGSFLTQQFDVLSNLK